jgi:hypothetical protein
MTFRKRRLKSSYLQALDQPTRYEGIADSKPVAGKKSPFRVFPSDDNPVLRR